MSIELKHEPPASYRLGGARFETDTQGPSRRISVHADAARLERRPILLTFAAEDHRTLLDLSIEEAEALVAAIRHAVALRRAADDANQTKAAA